MVHTQSHVLFDRAQRSIPGGVNSPARAFRSVGGRPVFVERAAGSRVYDVDGNEYIDYVLSWGPLILGHAHPQIVETVARVAAAGTSFGAPTEQEIQLAERVVECVPSIEKVRMVNSGTEATMSAIRLARGFTGRDRIVKFDGCYHGHGDSFLIEAGSGVATLGIPGSPGIPESLARDTISLSFNDLDVLEKALTERGSEIAAVILEPIMGNMGVIPPQDGFLQGVRDLTREHDVLLIFDEVITGFRVALGGAQELYGILPDLTCLGKIIGGGLPVGAYGGRKEIMDHIAPDGPVYQAGTLSGNPLAMAAGYETLSTLQKPGTYELLERLAGRLADGLSENARQVGIPVTLNRVGAMMSGFFTEREVKNAGDARGADTDRFARYFAAMLDRGINIAPSQFEAAFVSLVHSEKDIDRTVEVHREALRELT